MKILAFILVLLISTSTFIGCTAQASTPTKSQEIVISYFSIVDSPPNIWDSSFLQPSLGTELVITNINIENHGYNAFETDKDYFSAVVAGVPYKYDSERYANNLLPDTKISNGGKAEGNLTFTLPDATFGTDITLNYAGPGEYNIKWINQNLSSS